MIASPLGHPTYLKLFSAQVVALLGTGLATVALALLAFDLAGDNAGAVLGTALAIKMVAYVLVAPVVGGIAHRLPRRALLVGCDVARAACVACLPLVTEIWQIYVLIFLLNACSAGFTPVFQATIPQVLTDEGLYTRALSLSRLAYDLENLLSPALAALALVVMSYGDLFVVNAVAFGLSAALILSTRLRGRPDAPAQRDLLFGLRAYLRTPRLRALLALSLAVAASGAMVIVNTVVYVRANLAGSETETAIALAATGAGSMLIALGLPALLDRFADRRFMLAGGILAACGLAGGILQPGYDGLLAIWFFLGAGASLVQTPAGRLLLRSSHESDRPGVYAAQFALSHLCWLLTYPLAGFIGATFGLGAAFAVLAALAVVGTTAAGVFWPASDDRDVEHTHQRMAHEHVHTHDDHHQHEHEGWEGPEPHSHAHVHAPIRHKHTYVIDLHHPRWPTG